jgi:hypothetical protein
LTKLVGYKPGAGVRVLMHGERTFWLHDGLWFDYAESPDDSS